MASYMTVLRAPTPQQATKTARLIGDRWVTKPQGQCKQFTPIEVEVTAIDDVAGVIELVRQEDQRGLLIAGRLTDRVRAELETTPDLRIFRRGTAGHGENGTIEDLPRDWVAIDIDSWVLPPGADLVNAPEAVIRAAVHDLLRFLAVSNG
jgi:hypothetical protein